MDTSSVDAPALRIRYRFPDAVDGAELSYDLCLGTSARAEPSDAASVADVTLVQSLVVADAVAGGQLAAQQALLDGSIRVEGRVTDLLAWRTTLDLIEAASAELRNRTVRNATA